MKLAKAKKYFKGRVQELKNMCKVTNPWVFLCASAMIDYLAKIVSGKDEKRKGYIGFIGDYLAKIDPGYLSFTYKSGQKDLPLQMYHVLRCGIVHSFSFIPDKQARSKGGRDRSIVISHRSGKIPHLSNFSSRIVADAANLVAEDFIKDIGKSINYIFTLAKTDSTLKLNIETWLKAHPPIVGPI